MAIVNKHHRQLLAKIKQGRREKGKRDPVSYLGSDRVHYHLNSLAKRQIAKDWYRENKNISQKELISLLDSLYQANSYEEKTIASEILTLFKTYRSKVAQLRIDKWLTKLAGWAEIDALCQSTFEPQEFLDSWQTWGRLIDKFSKSKQISKRRASLVLLTKAVRKNPDKRFAKMAFRNIDRLKQEKDVLITKAISWLLRSLIIHHRSQVGAYLRQSETSLPKIAIRETKKKLETGKKQ